MIDDSDLISAARTGDVQAYAQLYRRHSPTALRFARSLARRSADATGADPKDMVADGFARVLAASGRGEGPDECFRPALLVAIVNAYAGSARRRARPQPSEDAPPTEVSAPVADADTIRVLATAFGELPERWQLVLWHTEVERERPADVARLLGITPAAVATLAHRAWEGLRERYRQAHLASTTDPQCRPTADRLTAYAGRELPRAETEQVRVHLDGCDRCRLIVGGLAGDTARFRALLAGAVLGSAAPAYLAVTAPVVGLPAMLQRIARRRDARVGAAALAAVVALVLVLVSLPPTGPTEPRAAAPTVPVSPSGPGPDDVVPPPVINPPTPPGAPFEPSAAATAATTGTAVAAAGGAAAGPGAPGPSTEPAFAVTLEPANSLVRGRPALLRLTVTTRMATAAGAPITATVRVPAGVSLRVGNAGHGWTCTDSGADITCTRAGLPTGQTSKANIHVSIAVDAADGVPSVQVSAGGIPPVAAVASQGVTDKGPKGRGPADRP